MKNYPCHACGLPFDSPADLARHILTEPRSTHKKGRKWAALVLAKVKDKREFKPRQALPENIKDIVKTCVRELSGETKTGKVKCPQCRELFMAELEVEYIADGEAWRDSQSYLLVNCPNCRRKK